VTLRSRLQRLYRRLTRAKPDARDVASLRAQAMCAGTLPCPHCRDTGPHEDNSGLGGSLAFRCRHCRSLFKMSTYDWSWAWNQPLSDYGKDRA